jgi:hypothetical protein
MCIKLTRQGKKITGVKLDFKATVITFGTMLTIMSLWTTIEIRCNHFTINAQEKIIRPEAIKVFNELHKPFEIRVDSMQCTNKLIIEMIKLSNPDKPWLLTKAKSNLKNPPGSFPVEGEE